MYIDTTRVYSFAIRFLFDFNLLSRVQVISLRRLFKVILEIRFRLWQLVGNSHGKLDQMHPHIELLWAARGRKSDIYMARIRAYQIYQILSH